ncbi:MAG: response regulator transcription factor [Defluviitaleaceae bacterium]|nr:response regulator transcription factor [Defluviitaleaceae bacterium]
MLSVLVVEDDKNIRRLMQTVLSQNGYNALCASDGREALEIFDREHVDLMVCDVMMPFVDGYELTESLRMANNNLPVLMVTARERFDDKQKGFLVGADDYMVKPIDINEMVLRVRALLRRSKIMSERRLEIGRVAVNYDALTVTRELEKHTLPQKEFFLLFKLLSYPDVIFTRLQLMDEIWGMDSESDDRTVDVHIKRLRERFYGYPEFEIITVRGVGYKAELRV